MTIEPFVKKRAIFTAAVMMPALLLAQYLGYDSVMVTGAIAGITGGLSVILFPDPHRQP